MFKSVNRSFTYLQPDQSTEELTDDYELNGAFTCNRFDENMENLVSLLEPIKYTKTGGSGNKSVMVRIYFSWAVSQLFC